MPGLRGVPGLGRVAGPGGCLVPGDIWSGGIPGLGGAWSRGCLVWEVPGGNSPPPRRATATGGTHPTGIAYLVV